MTRRIVCAAIRADDGEILIGIRHYSADMRLQIGSRPDGEKFYHRSDEDQGFVDQHGVYLTRQQAYGVAYKANQIVRPEALDGGVMLPPDPTNPHRLYSEALY